MADYVKLAESIIENVGGKNNISDVLHCMTRLRLVVKDQSKINEDAIKKLTGVLGTGYNAGQFQVIIGSDVDEVYATVAKTVGIEIKGAVEETEGDVKKKMNIIEKFTSLVSSVFLPITYPIAGCGLVSGLMALCTSQGWMSSSGDTYTIFSAISDGIFCFLPFLIAFSAAKYFKANGYVSCTIVAALVYPTILSAAGTTMNLFGFIPTNVMSYTYSIIPIIVMVWLQSVLEKWLKSFVPKTLDMILTPLVVVVVMTLVTLTIVGPTMTAVSNVIGIIFTWLFDSMPFVGGILMGMFYPWLVIAGVHLAFVPIQLEMLAKTGITLILPYMGIANIAQSGAAFGVMLKTKNKELKSTAASASFAAAVGITEPALYGFSVRFKKPFYAATISSIAGSIIFAIAKMSAAGLALSPLGALPLYFGEKFGIFLIGIAVTFIISAILTYIFGVEGDE